MAFYHSFDEPSDSHTFIILNPSLTFQTHFKEARSRSGGLTAMRWQDLHIAAVYSMSFGWREYVNYLELQFRSKVSRQPIVIFPDPDAVTANKIIHGPQKALLISERRIRWGHRKFKRILLREGGG